MFAFPDLELVCCSMSGSNCCVLTFIQISQETGQVVWYSYLLKNFPQSVVIHTVKGFGISRSRCFSGTLAFSMIQQMLALWSQVPLPFLNPVWTSGVHGSRTVEHYFASVWDNCGCLIFLCDSFNILWHHLSLGLEWKLTFSSSVATAEFSRFAGILTAALSQHHLLGLEIAQLEFHHLHLLFHSDVS